MVMLVQAYYPNISHRFCPKMSSFSAALMSTILYRLTACVSDRRFEIKLILCYRCECVDRGSLMRGLIIRGFVRVVIFCLGLNLIIFVSLILLLWVSVSIKHGLPFSLFCRWSAHFYPKLRQ